jgi:transcriptional regulator with XRE-family HTH domain
MPATIPSSTLEKFTTFGGLLRFLCRRADITQMELAIAVGYSDAQISRLEQNLRMPDIPTIEARFVTALGLERNPKRWRARANTRSSSKSTSAWDNSLELFLIGLPPLGISVLFRPYGRNKVYQRNAEPSTSSG